ncbi:unnamed protein product [Zymoseptoria tritici ST99CH_3D1]|nr:unnamed protein product [Zymoseptoria tritici ST99CH_3D1]
MAQAQAPGGGGRLPSISVSRTSSKASTKQNGTSNSNVRSKGSDRQQLPRVETERLARHHARHDAWLRNHDTEVEWKIKWDRHSFKDGRVLIIDYISNEHAQDTDRRQVSVAAQEFQSIEGLRQFYADSTRVHGAALRVVHVQNAPWAVAFLLAKFNIDHPSEVVGMQSFSKWARYEKPRQRKGKPFPSGRSWRGQTDPWRNISRTAFGFDYLKAFPTEPPRRRKDSSEHTGASSKPTPARLMHLNAYDDAKSPHGYDISIQRVSVYVQRDLGEASHASPDVAVKNPYAKPDAGITGHVSGKNDGVVDLDTLDNSNTVIVFEISASSNLNDCLSQPRNDYEKRWRRLSFYPRKEDVLNDSRLAAQCTDLILRDIFNGLGVVWNHYLVVATDHVSILEDKIYENPADESRAPELWLNQANWLKAEKVMWIHCDLINEMQVHMRELAAKDHDDFAFEIDWLANTPGDYERMVRALSDDLIAPTNSLSDLLYKSVNIRDAKQSLQLGLSMWRLSWITFIFLPLTFIVGFFGMNVSLFGEETLPGLGWYFVAAGVLMVLVICLWYFVKHSAQRTHQAQSDRGKYESLYSHLEEEYPGLWTRSGAAPNIEPIKRSHRLKWRLIKRWFTPTETETAGLHRYAALTPDEQISGDTSINTWTAIKRKLLMRWLGQISNHLDMHSGDADDGLDLAEMGASMNPSIATTAQSSLHAVHELVNTSTPISVAEAEPSAVASIGGSGLRPLVKGERRQSEERPGSRGSSGIMLEERNLSDSESDAGEHARAGAASGRESAT